MDNRNGALAIPGWRQKLQEYWQNPAIRIAVQILVLLSMGALATLGKRTDLSLGIPGSSAPLWLGPLILGRALVRRDGAGTLMGVSVAIMGVPIGLNNGFMHNLWLYGLTGVALDVVARIPKISITTWYGALICGLGAHLVKFGYIFSVSFFSSAVKHFLIVGVLQSLGLHILFGIVAGLLGWSAYRVYKFATSR